ncbi:MAG TPA: hypothetical protein VMT93_04310 [Gemmatimonadaceae bacterium]|nr:hypothetical protein [Gemmatimonadaceae bacterium]
MRAAPLLLIAALALPLAAQHAPARPPERVACMGQTIADIVVITLAPLEKAEPRWYDAPVRVMKSTHATTRPAVVRAFLQLAAGEPCDEFRRRESERVLREQPFIASADVAVYQAAAGKVTLVVTTRDEFSFIIAMRVSGASPYLTALTLGDGNLGGRGISAAGSWSHNSIRDGFGIAISDYALFGQPVVGQLALSRGDLGVSSAVFDLSHPFYTNAQRFAWRVAAADLHYLEPFQRADTAPFDVGVTREFAAAGAGVRIGRPAGAVLNIGAGPSTEFDATGVPATGYDSTLDYAPLFARYAPYRSVRANLFGQLRAVSYARGVRLGTLNGTQDLKRGLEIDALVGRGFGGIDGSTADRFASGLFYLGLGGGSAFSYLQAVIETRRVEGSGSWADAIGSARWFLFDRVGDRHTVTVDAEFGGGWRTTRPFELDIGQPEGGVRGFGASHEAGGQRVALKVEDRWFIGSMGKLVDLGLAPFVDIGRLWAGDVPYGTSTAPKVGMGVGFLAATPSGSRRTYRMDVAFPVTADPHAGWEVRVTVVNIAELGGFHEPADVTQGRELITTATNFSFPR